MSLLNSNSNVSMIVVAILPAILLMVKVHNMDRLEKEPTKLLVSLVFLGLAAVVLSLITELAGSAVLQLCLAEDTVAYQFWLNFVVVAVSEEFFKFLFLKIRTWRSPSFDCQFDAIVYAVFLSLGFALFENLAYTFQYGLETALARAVTAIPGHASFGVFMGVFYGIAKKASNRGYKGKSRFYQFLAVFIPVLLHGGYDYCATDLDANILPFIILFILTYFAAYLLLLVISKSDKYIDKEDGKKAPED